MDFGNLGGWIDNPAEVERIVSQFKYPLFGDAVPKSDYQAEKKDTLLFNIFREVVGGDAPKGPQKIGDCVSWGWSNSVNYAQAVQIKNGSRHVYSEIATEATYALSRVEYGNLDGSYSDGSVGAWAALAAAKGGYVSRKYLESKGLSGAYDPRRAKEWGAKGLPDDFEPEARMHLFKSVTMVTSFEEAAEAIQRLYSVPVCSNRGFTMTRDKDGFCRPSGTWNHCMLFCGVIFGSRPGLLCSQSWGANTPSGPKAHDQPDNTFFVDADVADGMLKQRDSYIVGSFDGFPDLNANTWAN